MDIKLIFQTIAEDTSLSDDQRAAADLLTEGDVGSIEPHLENYQWSLVYHSPSGEQTKVGDI